MRQPRAETVLAAGADAGDAVISAEIAAVLATGADAGVIEAVSETGEVLEIGAVSVATEIPVVAMEIEIPVDSEIGGDSGNLSMGIITGEAVGADSAIRLMGAEAAGEAVDSGVITEGVDLVAVAVEEEISIRETVLEVVRLLKTRKSPSMTRFMFLPPM